MKVGELIEQLQALDPTQCVDVVLCDVMNNRTQLQLEIQHVRERSPWHEGPKIVGIVVDRWNSQIKEYVPPKTFKDFASPALAEKYEQ